MGEIKDFFQHTTEVYRSRKTEQRKGREPEQKKKTKTKTKKQKSKGKQKVLPPFQLHFVCEAFKVSPCKERMKDRMTEAGGLF